VPYVTFHEKGQGQVVAITQRQLAFIVSNVIMGNDIGTGNGLTATIHRCSQKGTSAFVYSLLSLLAVLSQELASGAQGTTLIGTTPKAQDGSWKQRLESSYLQAPVVHREDGGYVQSDFMSGGVAGQALTDIAGTVVGGGAQLCDLANSQDESLVQFYSEVLAFVFFASPGKMLPVPWTLLGARRYMGELTGESAASGPVKDRCGHIAQVNWLNQGIAHNSKSVRVNGAYRYVADSAFVAVASKCSAASHSCPLAQAVNNNCDSQRRHAEADIGHWYQAFESTMYAEPVQEAFTGIVRRIGTGPWGAGVWFGDSQQYFLAVWLATALLGRTALDYYVYDHFCENPANQCFVLGSAGCSTCISRSGTHNINWARCGSAGMQAMISRFSGRTAKELFLGLRNVGPPPTQVFDLLASWQPSAADLATHIAAPAPAPPSPTPTPAPSPAPMPGPMPGPMPLPPPSVVPVVPVAPSPAVPGTVPGTVVMQPTQPAPRHCVSLLFHRRFCLPTLHVPHLR